MKPVISPVEPEKASEAALKAAAEHPAKGYRDILRVQSGILMPSCDSAGGEQT